MTKINMMEDLTAGLYERARQWAVEDERVAAAFVYGSVAHGHTHDLSDLDLLVVAQPSQRDQLWLDRELLAERILGASAIFQQEPSWQRPFRYQAWRSDLVEVDLTFDESMAAVWEGLTIGFLVLVDRSGIADRLQAEVSTWQRPDFDAAAQDKGMWPGLLWILGRLRHGQNWLVWYSLVDTLYHRVLPVLGAAGRSAERMLAPSDLQKLYEAAPRSADTAELARSLRATAELYNVALDRWAARSSKPRPRHPLASGVLDRICSAIGG